MPFVIGDHVWFKVAGSTPYVRGNAADPALAVGGGANDLDFGGSSLGGRGKPTVSKASAAKSGLSDVQGVPTLDFTTFPAALESTDTVDDGDKTFPTTGEKLGVREQITGNNPLAPGQVSTVGVFDGPTSSRLTGLGTEESGVDEGDVTASKDTIRDIDPNFPSGRTAVEKAGGAHSQIGGTQDFVSEVIDQKGAKTVGVRLPSSQEGAGVVIEIVTVVNAGSTPDGTIVKAGDKMCWVDWGSSAVSNPHRSKSNNRMRTSLHASADLVAA